MTDKHFVGREKEIQLLKNIMYTSNFDVPQLKDVIQHPLTWFLRKTGFDF